MDQLIRSTKSQVEDFKEGLLWKDIKRELMIWKRMAKNEYSQIVGQEIEKPAPNSNILMHLGSIYGREATVNYLLALPDVFIQILEERKNDT